MNNPFFFPDFQLPQTLKNDEKPLHPSLFPSTFNNNQNITKNEFSTQEIQNQITNENKDFFPLNSCSPLPFPPPFTIHPLPQNPKKENIQNPVSFMNIFEYPSTLPLFEDPSYFTSELTPMTNDFPPITINANTNNNNITTNNMNINLNINIMKKHKKKHKKRRSKSNIIYNHNNINMNMNININKNEHKKKHKMQKKMKMKVKGTMAQGYRMILEEPVNKSMLSCHQCKNKKTLIQIIVCGHVYRLNSTVKTCTKKYCKSCLLRFYLESPPSEINDPIWSAWKCPCCRYICCCAWCRKKKAKRLTTVTTFIQAEAHRLTPAVSLARKLVNESRMSHVRIQDAIVEKKKVKDVKKKKGDDNGVGEGKNVDDGLLAIPI